MGSKYHKVHGEFIDLRFVKRRKSAMEGMGYQRPKYLVFAEEMLKMGYKVKLHEAYNTNSKYITVYAGGDLAFKVRFSNHKPIKPLELAGSCDFFVGRTHTGVRTTGMAIAAATEYFCAV